MLSGNFAEMTTSTPFRDPFTSRKSTTWDRRLYLPSEGRSAEDFFVLKHPTASARFEPANLGTKGQHAAPRFIDIGNQKLATSKYKIVVENLHGYAVYCFTGVRNTKRALYWHNIHYSSVFM